MKRSRFSEEQIIATLKEQEAGMPTADVCRRHGVSSATFYKWEAKFGGLEVSDAKRLRQLEDENAKLKKLLAEAMLDNAILKEITAKKMVAPAVRLEAVAHLEQVFEVSQRRAYNMRGVDRTMVRYCSRRGDDAGTRSVVEPESGALRLLVRRLEPFTPPDALAPLVVCMPTRIAP